MIEPEDTTETKKNPEATIGLIKNNLEYPNQKDTSIKQYSNEKYSNFFSNKVTSEEKQRNEISASSLKDYKNPYDYARASLNGEPYNLNNRNPNIIISKINHDNSHEVIFSKSKDFLSYTDQANDFDTSCPRLMEEQSIRKYNPQAKDSLAHANNYNNNNHAKNFISDYVVNEHKPQSSNVKGKEKKNNCFYFWCFCLTLILIGIFVGLGIYIYYLVNPQIQFSIDFFETDIVKKTPKNNTFEVLSQMSIRCSQGSFITQLTLYSPDNQDYYYSYSCGYPIHYHFDSDIEFMQTEKYSFKPEIHREISILSSLKLSCRDGYGINEIKLNYDKVENKIYYSYYCMKAYSLHNRDRIKCKNYESDYSNHFQEDIKALNNLICGNTEDLNTFMQNIELSHNNYRSSSLKYNIVSCFIR